MEINPVISQKLKSKISQQWKTSFKGTNNRNKYQSEPKI